MSKDLVRRMESLNTRLWQAAIKFEKMRDFAEDAEARCEGLRIADDEAWLANTAKQTEASNAMRKLSWKLGALEDAATELAYFVDEIVDKLEEI